MAMLRTIVFASLALPAAAAPQFRAQSIDDRISIGYGLATADMDGDGREDIVLCDARQIAWYHNPDWKKEVIAENLTPRDHVCVAARDIDGDGRAEIAVGAQWNPGETKNDRESGAVFFLARPAEPGQPWKPVALPHEPTVHRMRWVRTGPSRHALVVVPLHGRGNANGAGTPVKIHAHTPGKNPADPAGWSTAVVDASLHITHNLDARPLPDGSEEVIIGGKEGFVLARADGEGWRTSSPALGFPKAPQPFQGSGEVRFLSENAFASVEPFHGPMVSVFLRHPATRAWNRHVIETGFQQGHALACADLDKDGHPEIAAGWREPDATGNTGIRIYSGSDASWSPSWNSEPRSMACEDLRIADLNKDGLPDLIAAGRATRNVVIYWNESKAPTR
jgi:hypothetical protein